MARHRSGAVGISKAEALAEIVYNVRCWRRVDIAHAEQGPQVALKTGAWKKTLLESRCTMHEVDAVYWAKMVGRAPTTHCWTVSVRRKLRRAGGYVSQQAQQPKECDRLSISAFCISQSVTWLHRPNFMLIS